MPLCSVCPSVHLSRIVKFFSPSGRSIILVFPRQTLWQYSNGNPPTEVSSASGICKNHDSRPIWCVVNGSTATCNKHSSTTGPDLLISIKLSPISFWLHIQYLHIVSCKQTWTIKEDQKRKLKNFEMAVLRKICGITRRDRRRNVDILKELQIKKDINVLWTCDSHGKRQISKYLDARVHTWTTT